MRKQRSDKGTRRKDRPEDKFYSFRLSQSQPGDTDPKILAEQNAIDWIEHYLSDPKASVRELVTGLISHFNGIPMSKEATLSELNQSFSQQLERLASTIDRLIASGLQARPAGQPEAAEDTGGVNMAYLRKIQETLRGKK